MTGECDICQRERTVGSSTSRADTRNLKFHISSIGHNNTKAVVPLACDCQAGEILLDLILSDHLYFVDVGVAWGFFALSDITGVLISLLYDPLGGTTDLGIRTNVVGYRIHAFLKEQTL